MRLFLLPLLLLTLPQCRKETPPQPSPQTETANPQLCAPSAPIRSHIAKQRPPPPLRPDVGNASLSITTSVPQAQDYFNNGLNLLHAFWDFEAYRAFHHVTQLDPDCAMGYWGMAACTPGNHTEFHQDKDATIQTALRLAPNTSPKEQAYIHALHLLHSDGNQAYAQAMGRIFEADPTDLNAGAIAAINNRAGYLENGNPHPRHQQALQWIEQILTTQPDHSAALHYAIHLYELGPDLTKALPLAERITATAPAASHIVHMPGHVHYFRGDYPRATEHFQAALQLDEDYLSQEKIDPADHKNWSHNLHFLALARIELGQLQQAIQHAQRLTTQPTTPNRSQAEGTLIIDYEGHSLPTRLHLRLHHWSGAQTAAETALAHNPRPALKLYLQALHTFATAMRAHNAAQPAAVTISKNQLEQLTQALQQTAASIRSTEENFYASRAAETATTLTQVLRALTASSPGAAAIQLDTITEKDRTQSRLDPPILPFSLHELIAIIHLHHQQPEKALQAITKAHHQRPNSPIIHLLQAHIHRLHQQPEQAAQARELATRALAHADPDLPLPYLDP